MLKILIGLQFRGETSFLPNKVQLIEVNNPEKKKSLIISPNHYPDYYTAEKVSTGDDQKDCLDVFDDLFEKMHRDISNFFTRSRH